MLSCNTRVQIFSVCYSNNSRDSGICKGAIQKVISGGLLTKQATRKNAISMKK
jgi:hypothetical protein